MIPRAVLILLALGTFTEVSRADDRESAATMIQEYFATLGTVAGGFVQVDPDGDRRVGWLAFSPPAKARIEYEPPDDTVLVADGRYLIFHDPEAGQVAHFPLEDTPLHVLLGGDLSTRREGGSMEILNVVEGDGVRAVAIAAWKDDERLPGWVVLTFGTDPTRLLGWTIADAVGRQTRVTLASLDSQTFDDPTVFRLTPTMLEQRDLRRGPWKSKRTAPTSPRG